MVFVRADTCTHDISGQQARATPARTNEAHASAHYCPGFKIGFPDGQIHHTLYPFALHLTLSLPWDYESRRNTFYVRAPDCARETHSKDVPYEKLLPAMFRLSEW